MNVLLIIADAVRRDHMGCYGYTRNTTPTLDRLAREGVRFRNCASNSSHTAPPTIAIATGRDSTTHGVMTAQDYALWMKREPTPCAVHALAATGYRVGGDLVKRWAPLGFERDEPELAAFIDSAAGAPWFYMAQPYPTHLPYNPPREYYEEFVPRDYHPSDASRRRLEIVKHAMICHPTGTTAALETDQEEAIPDEEMDESHARSSATVDLEQEETIGIRALYDGELRVLDDWMAATLETLRSRGALEDTLIVLMSDHGEELMERGHVGHSSTNLNGNLYDESMMVPLILWHASRLPKGRDVAALVSVMDVMPTIFDILGKTLPPPVDGRSMLPLVEGTTEADREVVFAEVPPAGWQRLLGDERRIRAARTAEWKLIGNVDPSAPETRWELYDLRADPGEQTDLYAPDHAQAIRLRPALERHFAGD